MSEAEGVTKITTAVPVFMFAEHWLVRAAPDAIVSLMVATKDGDYKPVDKWTVIGSIENDPYNYTVVQMPFQVVGVLLAEVRR